MWKHTLKHTTALFLMVQRILDLTPTQHCSARSYNLTQNRKQNIKIEYEMHLCNVLEIC